MECAPSPLAGGPRGFITTFKQMSVRRYLCILRRNDHLQILTGIPDGSLMQVPQSHEQLVFFTVFYKRLTRSELKAGWYTSQESFLTPGLRRGTLSCCDSHTEEKSCV